MDLSPPHDRYFRTVFSVSTRTADRQPAWLAVLPLTRTTRYDEKVRVRSHRDLRHAGGSG